MEDLQSFLDHYAQGIPGLVWHIRELVPRDCLITAAALEAGQLPEPPSLVCHHVDRTTFRSNVVHTRTRDLVQPAPASRQEGGRVSDTLL